MIKCMLQLYSSSAASAAAVHPRPYIFMNILLYYINHVLHITYIRTRITILYVITQLYLLIIIIIIIQDRRSLVHHAPKTHMRRNIIFFLSVRSTINFSKGSSAMRLRVCGPRVISVSVRMCLRGVRV